ncbi:hypothetical protein GNI_043030 [Gregarina niphandrodes]|uniref:Uncharacterized protein n=1 Tax=Gregarina niphandrodes TaxID=110365 RepID=A0A023BA52_GRENI|nr:hypothetical protein GNI_043030 [Gregarina niphandrodes]EZG77189.1 hypothetical protein GNI_043030 [Gregarina niphandrodes]|eukprot:XP_011129525.1 hypothetical protein GNI_043030 [Gregarina niphandrodes]
MKRAVAIKQLPLEAMDKLRGVMKRTSSKPFSKRQRGNTCLVDTSILANTVNHTGAPETFKYIWINENRELPTYDKLRKWQEAGRRNGFCDVLRDLCS